MRRPLRVLICLAVAASPAAAQIVERDVAYGPDALQRLDLWVPAAKPFPIVLFVHGGSLTSGDKADDDYGRVCAPFAAAGIGCANVNYRLAPAVSWPEPANDVAAAVAWVKANVGARGGDAHELFLLGHSSGAMLVALVGTDERYLARRDIRLGDIRGVIPMGSIMWDDDLEQALKQHGRDRVQAAFARDPDNRMYANMDVYQDRWPIRHVHAGLPPFLFLIAESEQVQPPVLMTNRKFVEDARALGNSASYTVLPGRTHYSAIRRLGEPGDPTFAIVRDFVRHRASDSGRGDSPDDWLTTGSDRGNSRYSALHQIDRGNVAQLRVAWTYHTGDLPAEGGQIQATPIVVDGVLYTTTPALAVVALRADSGTLLWRFAPPALSDPVWSRVNRGVVYWASGDDRRILYTAGRHLYALDARTGRIISTFGDSGSVNLARGLSRDIGDAFLVASSPGGIYDDLLIQGMRVGEGEGSAPGDVRAYDVRTGQLRWTFHTIPQPGEFGHDSWPADAWKTAGGANSWAGISVDTQRGIVYVPTGSATPDFYGGARVGANLFANTLLALDARTGRRLWHFQAVHHDLWDRDLPAAPNLATLNGVDAVIQITKMGNVFVFNRETGTPLFPIEERAAPPSDLAGEEAWPTQPWPTKPAPFARQSPSLWKPPSREGTLILPGFDGGGEWGGAAVDPSGTLYVNASDVPWIARMREAARIPAPTDPPRPGARVYAESCASCHGADRRGRDRAPSLVSARLSADQIRQVLESGRGFMPSFAALRQAEQDAVIAYLLGHPVPRVTDALSPMHPTPVPRSPYEFVGYERWRDSSGFPAIPPPWGTLSAIDLTTGEYRWRIPLGEYAALKAQGRPVTGTEQYGGPIVTAGGIVFIAATQDATFRALDSQTGKVLWSAPLPAPGFATPATFAVRGKQYVVVAAGGGKLGATSSDAYVAFALP